MGKKVQVKALPSSTTLNPKVWHECSTWFPSSPLNKRVPFFPQFGFYKGTQKEKGQRVLLGNLVYLPSTAGRTLGPMVTGPFII